MTLKKNDFIEIEFTGNITGTDEIFDTNIKADAERAELDIKDIKPFILSIGNQMLPKGFDEDIEGKEIEKSYTLDLNPEDAFGKRDPKMVRMIPTRLFHEQKIDPKRGMQLSLDGQLVRILSSDRGRTLVDFNNPLAGKKITYKYKINKTITDEKEKIDALQEFLFRKKFEFDKEEKIIKFKIDKKFEPFVKMFAPKFEEILGLNVESKIIEKK
ncbi:FKBP-type peptidyl-prolyl cis-trans isomerase [Candidatus Pacearchaeota archaeon]|nr:FKBP-type peptidyl-prolyl cis-trans isomerase [Candidatus Pacearchaeota archaeon]